MWWNATTTAPDPVKSDLSAATKFLSDERFNALSSSQRDVSVNGLAVRYLKESAAHRVLIDNALKARGIERSMQRSVAIAMLRNLLAEYRTLTAPQKQARIAALRAFATAMQFTGSIVSGLDPQANPVAKAAGSEKNFHDGVESFRRDLLNELNAEERATLSCVAHDIHQQN